MINWLKHAADNAGFASANGHFVRYIITIAYSIYELMTEFGGFSGWRVRWTHLGTGVAALSIQTGGEKNELRAL